MKFFSSVPNYERYKDWEKWFAWFPVETTKHEIIWLKKVWRKWEQLCPNEGVFKYKTSVYDPD